MRAIYKYPLETAEYQQVALPVGHKILSVQLQGRQLCLWAVVDVNQPSTVLREVYMVGTGHPFDADQLLPHYFATVQQGVYVWHVFVR